MPKPREKKVLQIIQAIKNCGWRSTNQFVEYSSAEVAQSLRYQTIRSRDYMNEERPLRRRQTAVLNLVITRKSAEIMCEGCDGVTELLCAFFR